MIGDHQAALQGNKTCLKDREFLTQFGQQFERQHRMVEKGTHKLFLAKPEETSCTRSFAQTEYGVSDVLG